MAHFLVVPFFISLFFLLPTNVLAMKNLTQRFRNYDGVVNPCYEEEWTVKGISECLQDQIEAYYGSYFTAICPTFALHIADWHCEGCPWATINSTAIYESELWKNRDNNTETDPHFFRKLFPRAEPSCALADQAYMYRDFFNVEERVVGISSLGGLLLIFAISALSIGKKQVKVLGRNVPEPLFVFTIAIITNIAYILIYAANDFYNICESPSTVLSLEAPDGVSYAIITLLYLRRCGHLEVPHVYDEYQSWYSFISSEKLSYKHPTQLFIAKLFYCVSPIVLLLSFVFDHFQATSYKNQAFETSMCLQGMSTKLSNSLIQFSKLFVELFAITIYAFGPSKNRCFFFIRYFTLASLIIIAVGIGVVQSDVNIWNPNAVTQTIPRVMDWDLAYQFVEITLTVLICLMGLLEPLRIGWPTEEGFIRDPPSMNWRRFTFGHSVDM